MKKLCVCLLVAACGAPPAPAQPEPIEQRTEVERTISAEDALCCCTFESATPEDFPDVNTWDSAASACPTGGAGRMPGQCIPWQWCGYGEGEEPRSLAERPDLAPPPPLADSECCCDEWRNGGEAFSILGRDACAHGACIDDGFCR